MNLFLLKCRWTLEMDKGKSIKTYKCINCIHLTIDAFLITLKNEDTSSLY